MLTAKVFTSGWCQTVRLPKECRFSADEVYVKELDGMVILFAPKEGWDLLARSLDHFTEDFLDRRCQPDGGDAPPAL